MNIKKKLKRTFGKLSSGHVPNFIIVGAQKAGTSSLHSYLSHHPSLVGSKPKEVHYFCKESNYRKGLEWYKSNFKSYKSTFKKDLLFYESTPNYLYDSLTPDRICEFNPQTKIIILLREPVSRAFSAWNMVRVMFEAGDPKGYFRNIDSQDVDRINMRDELFTHDHFPSFEQCISSEFEKINSNSGFSKPSFIREGIYYPLTKRYIDLFGKDQVLIVGFRELIDHQKEAMNRVLDFLGMEPYHWGNLKNTAKNSRVYVNPMSIEIEAQLSTFYAPHNDQLYEYLGFEPNW